MCGTVGRKSWHKKDAVQDFVFLVTKFGLFWGSSAIARSTGSGCERNRYIGASSGSSYSSISRVRRLGARKRGWNVANRMGECRFNSFRVYWRCFALNSANYVRFQMATYTSMRWSWLKDCYRWTMLAIDKSRRFEIRRRLPVHWCLRSRFHSTLWLLEGHDMVDKGQHYCYSPTKRENGPFGKLQRFFRFEEQESL